MLHTCTCTCTYTQSSHISTCTHVHVHVSISYTFYTCVSEQSQLLAHVHVIIDRHVATVVGTDQ